MNKFKRIIKSCAPYFITKRYIDNKTKRNLGIFPLKTKTYSYHTNSKINNLNKLCIFAFYDSEGKISDLDCYYIRKLSEIFTIILVGDCKISLNEFNKIKNVIYIADFKRRNKYDFGSYYIGYKLALDNKLINDKTEILLANNSCIGPIFNLRHIVDKMNNKKCDFWGLNSSLDFKYHLQSYFIYFKNNILKSDSLYSFLKNVKEQPNENKVIEKYEVNLTSELIKKSFVCKSMVPLEISKMKDLNKKKKINNKMAFPLFLIKNYKFPLIKKKIFINKYDNLCNDNLIDILDLIKKYNKSLYKLVKDYYF